MARAETLEERKAKLAEVMRLDPKSIATRMVKWADLATDGVVAFLYVGRWRGFTNVSPRMMGIEFKDEQERREWMATFKGGIARLMLEKPMNELQRVEQAGRSALHMYTVDFRFGERNFSFFKAGADNFFRWQQENEKLRAEYFSVAQKYADRWQENCQELLDGYESLGRDAWKRMSRETRTAVPEEKFVGEYVQMFKACLPTKEAFLASIKWEARFEMLELTEKRVQVLDLEAEQSAELAIMRMAVWDSKKESFEEQVVTFVTAFAAQAREILYEAVAAAWKTAKDGDGVNGRSMKALRDAVTRVQAIMLPEDQELVAILDQIGKIMPERAGARPPERAVNTLDYLTVLLRKELSDMGVDTETFEASRKIVLRDDQIVVSPDVVEKMRTKLYIPRQPQEIEL